MKSERGLRVAELIRHALGRIFISPKYDFREDFLTVTEVRLSKDGKYAKAWVSVLGNAKQGDAVIAKLAADVSRIRRLLAGEVRLRSVPELTFVRDTTSTSAQRIDEILKDNGIELLPSESDEADDPSQDG